MTISSWLNASLQFLVNLAQSDMFIFILLAIAMMSLYGVFMIIWGIINIFKR